MDGELYNPDKETYRYCLIGNINAKNPLVVLGLNPSTADNSKPDPTMKRVIHFMEQNGFDGFIMINLYPLRTSSPKELKKHGVKNEIHEENLKKIRLYIQNLKKPACILLGFGTNIEIIPKLKDYLKDIVSECQNYKPKWYCLCITKYGHPGHLLYLPENLKLNDFDVNEYCK